MLKNKSLLVKFLMLICAFCCSLALMVGLTACGDGKDGKDGADGVSMKTAEINADGDLIITMSNNTTINAGKVSGGVVGKVIVSMTVNGNGDLVVTYNDKTTDTLKLPTSEVQKCDHQFYEYELEAHELAEDGTVIDGVILQVCEKNCGTAFIKKGALHHRVTETVAPTCTEEGYTVDHCADCGYVWEKSNIVPATGHTFDKDDDWHNWHFVDEYENGKLVNVCENGGMRVRVCDVCDAVEYVKVEATGHHSDNWSVKTAPTNTAKGALEGLCGLCGENKTVDLPAFLDKDGKVNTAYTYEITKPKTSCEDTTGKATYSIVVDGQTFTFDVALPATEHILNGEEMPDKDASNNWIVYEVKDYPGLELAVNEGNKETCAETGSDYVFVCEECGGPVIVKGRVSHAPENAETVTVASVDEAKTALEDVANRTKVYTVPATCGAAGSLIYYCADCDAIGVDVIAALGHDYAYTLTNVKTENGKTSGTLVGVCKHDATHTVSIEAKDITITEVKATCDKAGSKTYSYTYNGQEYTIVETLDMTKHQLNGVEMDDSIVYEWTQELQDKGVKLAVNEGNTLTCADGGANAVFTCSECGGPVIIQVKVSHTMPKVTANTKVASVDEAKTALEDVANRTKVYEVAATCTEKGAIVYFCSECKQIVEEEIAALGHSVKVTLTKNDDNTYTFTSTCQNEGCKDASVNFTKTVTDVKEEVIKQATCAEQGQVKYTYTDPDTKQTATLTLTTATIDHTIVNGDGKTVSMPDDVVYEFTKVQPWGVELAVNPGNEFGCESKPANAVFTCSTCGGPVIIQVSGPHARPENAKTEKVADEASIPVKEEMAADTVYVVDATCTTKAVEAYICRHCGELVTEYGKENGHKLSYKVTTEPTLAAAGEVTVTCSECELEDTIVLPQLNDKDYKKTSDTEATCEHEGADKYAFTYEDKENGYTYSATFTVTLPKTAHKLGETLYTWDDKTYEYTGHICEYCDHMIVATKEFLLIPTLEDTYLDVVDGKVVYTVTGTYVGNTKNNPHAVAFDLENGGKFLVSPENTTLVLGTKEVTQGDAKVTVNTFVITADVTDMAPVAQNSSWFPHLYVLGDKYADSAMANASKKGTQAVFVNGYAYIITQTSGSPSWNMPVLSKISTTQGNRTNLFASLEEKDGKAYAVINGILGTMTKEDFEALNYVARWDLNGAVNGDNNWGNVPVAASQITKVANADGTFKIMIDITDLEANGKSMMLKAGVNNAGDVKLGHNGNQSITVGGKVYTLAAWDGAYPNTTWNVTSLTVTNA